MKEKKNKDVELLANILLNKEKGMEWYYFNLDLNSIFSDGSEALPSLESVENKIQLISSIETDKKKSKDDSVLAQMLKANDKSSLTNILSIILRFANENPSIFKEVSKRIFDLNEIPNKSDANQGLIGKFNEKDRAYRNSLFFSTIKQKGRQQSKVILAEGDSWFQFPRLFLGIDAVKDVIDHLMDEEEYAIYSLAYGGDWLSNILSLGEYVEELPKLSPDVFLISGGGNDMVGSMRLATMVHNPFLHILQKKENQDKNNESPKTPYDLSKDSLNYRPHILKLIELRKKQSEDRKKSKTNTFDEKLFDEIKYKNGVVFLLDEFFQFINLVMVQYFLFMYNINQSKKYPQMMIVTQGYDFPIPKEEGKSPHQGLYKIWNNMINSFNGNGKWLSTPLKLKGIPDEYQKAVVYVMIYEFNEMLIQLAEFKPFESVFHIDSRGIAEDKEWFDELHLTSDGFKKVAKLYEKCIEENSPQFNLQKIYTKKFL